MTETWGKLQKMSCKGNLAATLVLMSSYQKSQDNNALTENLVHLSELIEPHIRSGISDHEFAALLIDNTLSGHITAESALVGNKIPQLLHDAKLIQKCVDEPFVRNKETDWWCVTSNRFEIGFAIIFNSRSFDIHEHPGCSPTVSLYATRDTTVRIRRAFDWFCGQDTHFEDGCVTKTNADCGDSRIVGMFGTHAGYSRLSSNDMQDTNLDHIGWAPVHYAACNNGEALMHFLDNGAHCIPTATGHSVSDIANAMGLFSDPNLKALVEAHALAENRIPKIGTESAKSSKRHV